MNVIRPRSDVSAVLAELIGDDRETWPRLAHMWSTDSEYEVYQAEDRMVFVVVEFAKGPDRIANQLWTFEDYIAALKAAVAMVAADEADNR